jgi:lipopolysaccharide transport system ATP-binding protein
MSFAFRHRVPSPVVVFDQVWKKFRRGERHDSLRDAITGAVKRGFSRAPATGLKDNEFWVLRDVSFTVAPGEALGIIGPNGAGKSTTLKLLTRIMRPTTGACGVRGRVGALIEIAAGFHPDLTGRENVYLQGAIMGMSRAEVARQFDAIVEFAGIADFIDTPVKRYSSGMNARLGFAIAAHVEPDVLVIDEVLAVGDFSFQQKCHARLQQFRDAGAAIVFVSHNMQAITSLCDRAMLLRPGQPPLISTVEEVAATYAAPAAAAHDPRISVSTFSLQQRAGQAPVRGAIAPGTPLTLDVELRVNEALPRCCLGLVVVRTDGLVMFNGSPQVDGEPTLELVPGDVIRAQIHFRANVLRGTYRVVLNLADTTKRWPMIAVSGLASFVVHETTRVAGCAELEPAYECRVERAALALPQPA